ncbi:MAG: DUF4142 domain-containing protein [Pedobacter sp.]|uniref:DUF4142 domain-containing protein n=1 Tax=Pedobacter sp. TaxID=1411316 RepID=UPI0033915B86
MKKLTGLTLPALIVFALQACSLPKYDAGSYSPSSNTGVSTSSTDPVNSRPTDGTTFTGATPTGGNSGTSPSSAGMPSMGTANSTSSGISGDDLEAAATKRENTSFISQAASAEMNAIALSQLASKNSKNDAVKKLAEMLLNDYQKAQDELKTIASDKGIAIRENTGTTSYNKLSATAEKDFDQAYLKTTLLEHQKVLSLFKQASQFSDPVIKAYAAKYLPGLKTQQKQIAAINKTIYE